LQLFKRRNRGLGLWGSHRRLKPHGLDLSRAGAAVAFIRLG